MNARARALRRPRRAIATYQQMFNEHSMSVRHDPEEP